MVSKYLLLSFYRNDRLLNQTNFAALQDVYPVASHKVHDTYHVIKINAIVATPFFSFHFCCFSDQTKILQWASVIPSSTLTNINVYLWQLFFPA